MHVNLYLTENLRTWVSDMHNYKVIERQDELGMNCEALPRRDLTRSVFCQDALLCPHFGVCLR